MHESEFFNAHHSPIGAFASFTLGAKGPRGGLGLELGGPANQAIFIARETGADQFEALPFFGEEIDPTASFDSEAEEVLPSRVSLKMIPDGDIRREYTPTRDTWSAGDLSATIYTQIQGIPEPGLGEAEEIKAAIVPSVWAEIRLDNSQGTTPRRVVFGFSNVDAGSGVRHIAQDGMVGIGVGRHIAIVSDAPGVASANGFTFAQALTPVHAVNQKWMLGANMLLVLTVPAGEVGILPVAISFFRDGIVTTGIEGRYLYRKYFRDIEHVSAYALAQFSRVREDSPATDRLFDRPDLNDDQRFQLTHAVRSYYGSTQLLEADGRPIWVVNEGEYRMMNTFDLIADHLFYELQFNPWVVRNLLDHYVERYSYVEPIGGEAAIGFTHDMGVANQFSRPKFSSYERAGLTGCFSYMTHEELVNWGLCALTYVEATGDQGWFALNEGIFEKVLESMCLRDAVKPEDRTGIMSYDSARCEGGAEITTYDSLDASLGQARGNIYLAVKCFAAYVLFSRVLQPDQAALARDQATKCAQTLISAADGDRIIPAVLDPVTYSSIIPAIEGLIFLMENDARDAIDEVPEWVTLIEVLKHHFLAVLQPGICLFEDGGWKLSATSNNSWLSKIYLCQSVARRLFDLPLKAYSVADAVHKHWLVRPESAYYAWSDQMVSGIAVGSKYYPRGVTAFLWLNE